MGGKRRTGGHHGRPIPRSKIPPGIRRAHDNAERHLGDALCLYKAKRFPSAIPSAVLSLEESIKGMCLAAAHRKGGGVPASEWSLLDSHKFKLQNARRWAENGLDRDALVAACERHIHNTAHPLFGARPVSEHDALRHIDYVSRATLGLQPIKKMSTYENWNAVHGAWDTFGHLPEDAQDSLAVYVMHLAVLYHDLLAHSSGGMLGPSCARACGGLERIPGNPFSAASGRIVLDAMLATGTAAQYAYHITQDIFLKCRRVALLHGDYDNLHPFVNAMTLALSMLKEEQDGTYPCIATDASQTYGGNPMMWACLVVSREGGAVRFEELTINGDTCKAHDSRIGAILETELVIDRLPGSEAPLSAFSEAFSKLGIKVRKLKDEEAGLALENAQRMAENGQLAHFPPDMVDSIRHATREGWDELAPDIRSLIASMYVADPTVVVLSGYTDPIRKYKIRLGIWQTLCAQKAIHEGRASPWASP